MPPFDDDDDDDDVGRMMMNAARDRESRETCKCDTKNAQVPSIQLPFLPGFSFLAFLSNLGNEISFLAFLCRLFVILPVSLRPFCPEDFDVELEGAVAVGFAAPSTSISVEIEMWLARE